MISRISVIFGMISKISENTWNLISKISRLFSVWLSEIYKKDKISKILNILKISNKKTFFIFFQMITVFNLFKNATCKPKSINFLAKKLILLKIYVKSYLKFYLKFYVNFLNFWESEKINECKNLRKTLRNFLKK